MKQIWWIFIDILFGIILVIFVVKTSDEQPTTSPDSIINVHSPNSN